jgi:hypothetical protein
MLKPAPAEGGRGGGVRRSGTVCDFTHSWGDSVLPAPALDHKDDLFDEKAVETFQAFETEVYRVA